MVCSAVSEQPALQLIYDTAPIGLAFLSPDCRYLQINQRLTEICGISVEDHLGRSVRDCVPALAEAVEGIVRSIMETGEPVIGIEVAGQRADQTDERFWITYWHPLRSPGGEIVGVNVAAEEITERKRAEAALQAGERELRSAHGGPASANLQGRKPREVRRGFASDAMGISGRTGCWRGALTVCLGSDRWGSELGRPIAMGRTGVARRRLINEAVVRAVVPASMVVAGREPTKRKCSTGMSRRT